MAYFECIIGGISDGNTLIVTCDEDFAGLSITCTNGTDTYTETCPSTSPYTVQFEDLAAGTWTISGTIGSRTYSTTVTINDSYTAELDAGFSWEEWLTLGGLDPSNYNSLAEVLADEAAVRRLMTIHASADFLISQVNADITVLDDFTASDNAMKWIGLRDYVCDGLTNIAGVEAELMGSEYWERYLKDHVPIMTSDTAPYGTASASGNRSGSASYYAFDGGGNNWQAPDNSGTTSWLKYSFTNPIVIKKVGIYNYINSGTGLGFKIQGSNDNSTWTDLLSATSSDENATHYFEVENNNYYMHYRLVPTQCNVTASGFVRAVVGELQFYGRSLNVSVPIMTSNTAPYGEVIASNTSNAYYAFDGNESTFAQGTPSTTNQYFGYKFVNPINVKKVHVRFSATIGTSRPERTFHVYGSNDNSTWSSSLGSVTVSGTASVDTYIDCSSNNNYYQYYRLFCADIISITNQWAWSIHTLQFYGLDYSEREFATGSTMKYLYDHGLELETLEVSKGSITTSDANLDDMGEIYIPLVSSSSSASTSNFICVGANIDLSGYSLMRAHAGTRHVPKESNNAAGALRVWASKPIGTYGTPDATTDVIIPFSDPNTFALDISSFNQSKFIDLDAVASNGRVTSFNEWWLE